MPASSSAAQITSSMPRSRNGTACARPVAGGLAGASSLASDLLCLVVRGSSRRASPAPAPGVQAHDQRAAALVQTRTGSMTFLYPPGDDPRTPELSREPHDVPESNDVAETDSARLIRTE